MPNEIVLVFSLLLSFVGVLAFFRMFGKSGLYVWTAITTITANIEVLILIRAFGMEQTLGNCLFAATFLTTDILSECYGRKSATRAVFLGIATNVTFVCLSQLWFLYTPSADDWAMPAIRQLFSITPRLMGASLLGYAISEIYDVWCYHKLWKITERFCGSSQKHLWFRNNLATLSAQLINVVIFTTIAFGGIYSIKKIFSICISSYAIYVCTSILDTPILYFARWRFNAFKKKESNVTGTLDS